MNRRPTLIVTTLHLFSNSLYVAHLNRTVIACHETLNIVRPILYYWPEDT